MKLRNVIHILLGMFCIGILPRVQAVVPAPDGGYPNFTTAEGTKALQSLTTGAGNTGLGWFSLESVTTGSFNTGVGAGTLVLNTGDENTAVGTAALLLNTAPGNTALGSRALLNNIDGAANTATGVQALFNNTSGTSNVANGNNALLNNISGETNTAIGVSAMEANVNGNDNTAIGWAALRSFNLGVGNTAVGSGAGSTSSGNDNTFLGANAGTAVSTATNVICVGANVAGEDSNGSCYIGFIFGSTVSGGAAVSVNSLGKLGTVPSSRRFKDDITPMDEASEAIYALKPVTFRYKKEIDPGGTSQLGLVAEDVEKVNHDLVVRDKEGKPYSVRYDQVNAMLLNEFLKEHHTVQELKSNAAKQEATIAHLQKQVDALTAGLQKVSAQFELSKTAPQTVLNIH